MSIKRSRQSSYPRTYRDDDRYVESSATAEPAKTWEESVAGKADDAFAAYSMKSEYAKGALIAHPKFGKGVVTRVEGRRIDVLFAEGRKTLGHCQP